MRPRLRAGGHGGRAGLEPCRDWRARLSAWFDGEASEMDAAEVRAHLLGCPGCRAAASRWGALRHDLALLQAPEADAAALQRMAFRFERGLAEEVHDLGRALRLWRAAAAALLAAGLGLLAADRLVLPGVAQAAPPRDVELELQDLLERPTEPSAAPPRPAPRLEIEAEPEQTPRPARPLPR